ncbi:MAG TPA: LPXTG cell wall anchor domain-containing protein [Thermoleophilaceae bacterium]
MRPIRYFLVVVVGLMLLAPAALATGPSAGDQQYTDPLGGSNGQSNGSSTTPSSSNSTAPATAAAPSMSSSPTALAASSTSATTTSPSSTASGALPRTGFNAWLGAAFGVALLGAGLAVRRQVHRE